MRFPLLAAAAVAALASLAHAAPMTLGGRPEAELLPPHMRPRTRAAIRRLVAGFAPAESFKASLPLAGGGSPTRTLAPADFGAAGDCSADASPAFDALTLALANMTVGTMSDGIKDLGGVVVDLQGGCYVLSRTWAIPQFLANFHVTHGEIRALAPSFPVNGTLVQVGATPCNTPSGQGSCNQNAGFHGVTFDGSHVAGTLLTIAATMGAVVDSSSVFLNFVQNGLFVEGGHETMVSDSWFAAYPWNSPQRTNVTGSSGIWIAGNDHYVQDVIVYSSQFGAKVTGAANFIGGLHCWNLATGQGGVGMLVTMSQNRLDGIYMDYADLILEGTGAQQTTVTNGFFLGGAQIVFKARTGQQQVYGVAIANNEWYATGPPPLAVDESEASWTSVVDLVFSGPALQQGQPFVGVSASQVQTGTSAAASSAYPFNFTSQLLFPSVPIASASVTVYQLDGGANPPPASSVAFSGLAATAYVGPFPASYKVRVEVDQSQHTSEQAAP